MQQKKAKLIRMVRKQNIQSKIKKYREKQMLLGELEILLNNYAKCSLVNGQEELFTHQNYLHCERFIIESHQQLFQLIQQLTVNQSKHLLCLHSLPKKLTQVKQFVENKTLENDESQLQIHLLSKTKVLKSICHLFGLFTQEQDLVMQICEEVISLFCLQLRRQFPIKKEPENEWDVPIIGLINMFCYPKAEEMVYVGLKQANFQLVLENYIKRLLHLKEITYEHREFSTNVIILLKYYLQYQSQKTQDRLWKKFESVLGTYIIETIKHNITIDKYFHKDISENQLIDELLKLCLWVKIQLGQQMQLLKNRDLFKKNTYAQLLNFCSYWFNVHINLDTFSDDELFELLQSAKERIDSPNFEKYQKSLVSAISNMVQEVADSQTSAKRLWSLLEQTKTLHLFADVMSQIQEVKILGQMLSVYVEESQVV